MKPPYESGDDIARITEGLLRSFREDVAPVRSKKATLAALGLVGTTASAATVAGAASAATAGATSAWTGAAKVGALAIAKAVAGGALVGAVVVGTSSYVQSKKVVEKATAASVEVPSTPRRPEASPKAPEARLEPVSEPVPEGPAPKPVPPRQDVANRAAVVAEAPAGAPAAAVAPIVAPPPPLPERTSSLTREIALLDQARAVLAAGDARGAIRILDDYAATVGHGALEPEAMVLKIDALLHVQDVGAARRLADEFERSHPNDSHLARIRSLLKGAP